MKQKVVISIPKSEEIECFWCGYNDENGAENFFISYVTYSQSRNQRYAGKPNKIRWICRWCCSKSYDLEDPDGED